MNCDSQKERQFYTGITDAPVEDGGVERDLLYMVLRKDTSKLDDENIWYLLGAYTRHVMAGGKPFLDQADRSDGG